MKQSAAILAALVAFAAAEVPQEKSHQSIITATQNILQLNNRFNIVDPVFGLLGAAAAADGAGDVTNLDCLQQIIADEAFTNALALDDENERITGLANALLYRALEKNTGSVGLASVDCNETANNAEIAAISQHQDPASDNAQQINKDIVLNLAVQLASVGADPTLALLSGTFTPGDVNDPTGAGNTCDDDDAVGCIFTKNLIVADATIDEINQAVSDAMGAGAPQADADAAENLDVLAAQMASGQVSAAASDSSSEASASASSDGASNGASASASGNLQAFSGNLGGAAPEVRDSGDANRPFETNGVTFQNIGAAIQRSCAVQHNACANAANSGQIDASVSDCDAQEDQCLAQGNLAKVKRGKIVKLRQAGALDFGSCSDPTIQFAEGLDGRKEAAFAPNNKGDFSQGSALNINIITSFICGRLRDSCKADDATIQACETGQAAAQGQQGQAAADAFNAALGL
ncbi:hypothetical protein SAPIO_CDS7530 [Scedosporium apiospermum]|uniref:Uncharacterized protein n=1 Tax=Pseudallescheria apiosperma TaxID=563466 RepID=A0A084G242_PSEDA|nr:uncharacterized protein SAPIO_CDS7530 [Scedosporium apiospermum]KEZ41404.1 hypothetical protein SAPIO_CDS7530 [Scedosporium apiospermum]